MPRTYGEIFFHFVWSTYGRADQVRPEIQESLYEYISNKSLELGATVIAVNGTTNHIHIACVLPPRLSPAEYMRRIKGASAHYVNHGPFANAAVAWQSGYFVLSFSSELLPVITNYVRNQKTHHDENSIRQRFEPTDD